MQWKSMIGGVAVALGVAVVPAAAQSAADASGDAWAVERARIARDIDRGVRQVVESYPAVDGPVVHRFALRGASLPRLEIVMDATLTVRRAREGVGVMITVGDRQ